MQPPFSLAHLTALHLTPPELISLAADTGYQYAGVRMLPATPDSEAYALMHDRAMLRETIRRSRETGVGVFDLEILRLSPDFRAQDHLAFFEAGAELGARAMLVAGNDPDEQRQGDNLAALCEAARPFGLTADLEFMPWTLVPDLDSALRILHLAGTPENAGILVDAIHFGRSDSRLEQLAQIPEQLLHYAQICDAPAGIPDTEEALIFDARCRRLLPGEGGLDLPGIFGRLPRSLPISVEIPHHLRAPALGDHEWARQALLAAQAVCRQLPRT
jgi:sugar phosphate isomerase/epimerase